MWSFSASFAMTAHLLIIEARFYADLADELARGAEAALREAGATWDRVAVPGVLEIPAALAMALDAQTDGRARHDGFVLLGCVIRGETTHYDIYAYESAREIMRLATERRLALGNGILTVENGAQAWARARTSEKDKGGAAAQAALHMIALKRRFGLAAA